MHNFFTGFRQFFEKEDPNSFIHTLKQQLPINFQAFASQPVMVPAGKKFGKYSAKRPITLYVHDWDDATVTLASAPQDGVTYDTQTWDRDGEMNIDQGIPDEREEFILTHDEFQKLLEPPPQPPQPGF